MNAVVLTFPRVPGNPDDPNLPAITVALRESNPDATDTESRTFARNFGEANVQHERATRGMSKAEESEYVVSRLAEIFINAHVRAGMPRAWAAEAATQSLKSIANRLQEYRTTSQPRLG